MKLPAETLIEGDHNFIKVADDSSQDSIRVTRKKTFYIPNAEKATVRFRYNKVYLFLDDLCLEMTPPVAAKVGHQLVLHGEVAHEWGEVVLLIVNRKEINLLGEVARQIGGVMIKKADRSDDWQRGTEHIVDTMFKGQEHIVDAMFMDDN